MRSNGRSASDDGFADGVAVITTAALSPFARAGAEAGERIDVFVRVNGRCSIADHPEGERWISRSFWSA
jgi:hypothetical protein